jgi:microcystin-dependent protein
VSQPFIGEIKLVGFNFAPSGWAFCNGQLTPIDQNPALFQLIGTTYGGDGVQTFGLPNLQGRAALGQGNTAVIGAQSGVETVTITLNQYPSHTHPFRVNSAASGGDGYPLNQFLASTAPSPSTGRIYAPAGGTLQPLNTTNSPPALSSAPGSSQPHNNMQPYLAMSYIIALFGVFPSQN